MKRCIPVALALWSSVVMVAAQADNPPVQVDAKRDGDKVLISASFTADVPKELVWQVMIDFDHMAEFMPRLAQSRVVQREGDRLTVNQHGSVHVGFFDIPFDSTREIQLKPPGELDSRAIGGNNGPMQSVATLTQQGRQTVISYHAEWQPTSGFMASLGVDLIKSQLGEQFGAMRQEMLRRAARNSSQTAAIP